jgi:HD-GYP domain-containing protein (c-di-GMP phosphodiesterase class II)
MVLSSLALPKIDGYKLCQMLRDSKETEATPFMFIVDQGEFPDHLIGHESYAHDYIQKPISVAELQNRIHSLLSLVAPQDSARSAKGDLENPGRERLVHADSERLSRLGKRLKALLEEVASCLDQLEGLLTPQEVNRRTVSSPSASNQAEVGTTVDRPDTNQEELEKSKVEEYLNEFRDRVEASDPLVDDDVGEGLENVFSEFFRMEKRFQGESEESPLAEEELESVERKERQTTNLHSVGETSGMLASRQEDKDKNGLYEEAVAFASESLQGVASGNALDIFRAADITERLVDSLNKDTSLVLEATDRQQDYSVSRHAVNVATFSVRIAQTLGSDLQCQREVCLAGLLHELGVGKLPANLVHCVDPLSAGELKLLRFRQLQSGKMIKGLGPEYVWLGELISQINERENGTGYPLGLGGGEISERAKILGIADVFDACIHRRPYRAPVSGYQALFELTTDQQQAFSDKLVKGLIRSFSLYPFNECVRLSTGEIAKVCETCSDSLAAHLETCTVLL